MNSYQASWEDEENNREVLFRFEYELVDRRVQISSITPLQVSHLCPERKEAKRMVGVHTEKGRALLVRKFLEQGQLPVLENTLHVHATVAKLA